MTLLDKVKAYLGITGTYQDETLKAYITEVKYYLRDSGVTKEVIESEEAVGVIARGVSDLWNYGEGKLSKYFYQRASQLSLK